jgi:hypothetical protein
MTTCPCCGHEVAEVPAKALQYLELPTMQQRLVSLLAGAYPRAIDRSALVGLMWEGDPNGGPDSALRTMDVHQFRANKKLAAFGWRITSQFKASRKIERTTNVVKTCLTRARKDSHV